MIIPTLLSGLHAIVLNSHYQNELDTRIKSIWRRVFGLSENSVKLPLIWITGTPLPSTTWSLNIHSLFWNIWKLDSPTRQICYNLLSTNATGPYWINLVKNICEIEYECLGQNEPC